MTDTYKATPEQWAEVGAFASATRDCILELRARVEALEAQASNYPAIPDSSTPPPVAGGLVERVAAAIHPDRCADPNLYLHESRAAIHEVAKWLREQGTPASGWAMRLEQEAAQ